MLDRSNWQSVTKGYFRAIWEDAKASRENQLLNSESQFLKENGTDGVHSRHRRQLQEWLDSLEPFAEDFPYKIVEELDHRILVEVQPENRFGLKRVPFCATRLLLVRSDENWQIANMYYICCGCNTGALIPPGECYLCHGVGHEPVQRMRSFRLFRLPEKKPCEHCNGSGRCPDCAHDGVPGWTSAFALAK